MLGNLMTKNVNVSYNYTLRGNAEDVETLNFKISGVQCVSDNLIWFTNTFVFVVAVLNKPHCNNRRFKKVEML